jgi:hypothetical protein
MRYLIKTATKLLFKTVVIGHLLIFLLDKLPLGPLWRST